MVEKNKCATKNADVVGTFFFFLIAARVIRDCSFMDRSSMTNVKIDEKIMHHI